MGRPIGTDQVAEDLETGLVGGDFVVGIVMGVEAGFLAGSPGSVGETSSEGNFVCWIGCFVSGGLPEWVAGWRW